MAGTGWQTALVLRAQAELEDQELAGIQRLSIGSLTGARG
jgi:hypothetical protein